jgi:hypothetical protein
LRRQAITFSLRRTRLRQFLFSLQVFFVFDCALDGVDGVLDDDESLTHPFRLAALVWLRQCIRKIATLFYLTVPSLNQFSNVLVSLSHGVISLEESRFACLARFEIAQRDDREGLRGIIMRAFGKAPGNLAMCRIA